MRTNEHHHSNDITAVCADVQLLLSAEQTLCTTSRKWINPTATAVDECSRDFERAFDSPCSNGKANWCRRRKAAYISKSHGEFILKKLDKYSQKRIEYIHDRPHQQFPLPRLGERYSSSPG